MKPQSFAKSPGHFLAKKTARILCWCASLAFCIPLASAADGTWNGANGATWNTSATNWTGVTGTPWDSGNGTSNTANFTSTTGNATVSGTVFVNGISYTAASGSFAIESGTISVGGTTPSISVNPSCTLTINSTLDGSTAWSKAGTGTLILGGANTYTGNTTINAGVLNIRNNTALGSSAGGTTVASGAALQLQGNITVTGEALSLVGGGISTNGALRNISGNNTWTGNITTQLNNTRIHSDAGSLLTISGNISTAGFSTILQGNGTTNITGVISGALGGVTLSNTGFGNPIVTLSGNNTYTGATTINGGTLSIGTIANGGSNSNIGASATTASLLILGGGTLQYTGSGNSTDRNFTLTNSTSSTISVSDATATLTISGTSAVTTGNLIKSGAGILRLTGTQNYTGTTTVSGGVLSINSTASLPSWNTNGRYSVAAGATLAVNNGVSDADIGTILGTTNFSAGAAIGFDTTTATRSYTANITNTAQGTLGVRKIGANTLTLSGNNTYSGTTTISAGTLQFAKTASLYNATAASWTSSNIIVNSGAALALNVGGAGEFTSANIDTIDGLGGALNGFMNNSTLALDTTNAGNFTHSGSISNTNGEANVLNLAKVGAGTLILTANNTYTGNTTISGGTLQVGAGSTAGALGSGAVVNNGALIFNRSDNITVANNISGTGNLTQNASSILTLNGTNTYSGLTNISGNGVIDVGTISSNAIPSGSGILLGSSNATSGIFGILQGNGNLTRSLSGSSTPGSGQISGAAGGFAARGGQLTITFGNNASTELAFNQGAYLFGNNFVFGSSTADSKVLLQNNINLNSGGSRAITVNAGVGGDAATSVELSGVIRNSASTGGVQINKNGDGMLILSNASNSFNGSVSINNGTVSVNRINSVGGGNSVLGAPTTAAQGTIALGSTTSTGRLLYTGSGDTTDRVINLQGTTGGGIIDQSGLGTLKFTSNFTATGAGSKTLTLQGSTAGIGEISGAVVNNSAANTTSLTKNGTGTWVLSGVNTYTGATTINAGTLSIAAITNGGVAGALGNSTNAAGNLVLGGGTLEYTGSGNSTDRNFTLTAGTTSTISVTNSSAALTISGTSATTNGALTKAGSGTLILSGNNTYTGGTTINAGTLEIASTGRLGGGSYSASITNNGTFTYNGSNSQTLSGIISGSGALTKNASSTLTLSGNNTYTGITMISAGNLSVSHANALGATGVGSGTTVSGNTSSLQISGGITVAEAITLTTPANNANSIRSAGGSNILTGAINLSGAARSGISVASGGNLTLTGGVTADANQSLLLANSNSAASGNLLTISGSAINIGTGTLEVNGGGWTALNVAGNTMGTMNIVWTGKVRTGVANAWNSNVALRIGNNESAAGDNTNMLDINGFNQDVGSLSGTNGAGWTNTLTNSGSAATFTVNGSSSTTYAGGVSGNLSLAKSGTGTLTLSGNNTYTGTTTINAGVLNIQHNNGLGTAVGGTTVASGAALQLQGNITITGETLSLNGAGIGGNSGAIRNISGNNTWGGDITIQANNTRIQADAGSLLTISGGINTAGFSTNFGGSSSTNSTINVSGVISGSGAVTLSAANSATPNVTLSGNNTYTGATSVHGGSLTANTLKDFGTDSSLGRGTSGIAIQLGSASTNGTLNYTGGATSSNRTFRVGSNTAAETGGSIINNNGSGALTFSATALNLQSSSANTARILTLGGSNTDANTISGAIINNNASAAVGLVKADAGTWVLAGNNSYTGATTINAGTLQIGAGGASGNLSISSTITNNGTLVFNRSGNMTQATNFANSISGTGNLTQAGSGTLFLGGTNSYTGLTTISAGNLSINATTAVGSTSGINLANATALIYTGGAGNLTRDITVTSGTGTIRNSGTGLLTLSGALTKNSTTLTLAGGGNGITVEGVISGSANNSDLIIDGGTTTLANANNYNGPTFIINGATLNANAASALPTSTLTAVTINGSSTLALGASQSVASLSGTSGSSVNLNASTLTINGSATTTYSGGISGTGNLVKNGSGTQTLAGATTFTGNTTVISGTLKADAANALGGTTNIDVNGGSLLVAVANAINDNANIRLNGGRLAVSGNFDENVGALTLSANSTIDFSGFVGTLRFSGIGSWASGANLAIWNWSGQTQHGTNYGTYPNSSNLVFTNNSTLSSNLANISFYSDSGTTSIGSGFERGFTGGGTEIIAVPEPETYITAVALLLGVTFYQIRLARHGQGLLSGIVIQYIRRRAKRKPLEGHRPA